MSAGAKIGMKVLTIAIGIPVGIATRKAVEGAWSSARPAETPRKASDAGVEWSDAVVWGAISAIGIVVSDLVTQRGAAVAFKTITGNAPPPPKPGKKAGKGTKKLEQAAEKSSATNEG